MNQKIEHKARRAISNQPRRAISNQPRRAILHQDRWAQSHQLRPIEMYQSLDPQVRPFLFIGGVHGDEPEGVELAQKFLKWLLEQENLGQSLHPWILIPCLNVDGYAENNRLNGAGVDLNRNFPSSDWSPIAAKERYQPGKSPASEPEVKAVVDLIHQTNPSLIVHFHSWHPCIVYTGQLGATAATFLAERSPYEAKEDIGYPTPGSLGQYGWLNHQTPVICIEEQSDCPLEEVWGHFNKALPELMTKFTQDIKAIAIDLDDTLLDTTNLIVPGAAQKACEVLLSNLTSDNKDPRLAEALKMRSQLANGNSHKDIFRKIAKHFNILDTSLIEKAIHHFYCPEIPENLPLIEGAEKNLKALKEKYDLYIVTSGDLKTQRKKIQSLGIESYFKGLMICDSLKGETKKLTFEKIIEENKIKPWQMLSIGNRLSSEIREAKRCGAHTCHFIYGEHATETPILPEDRPDFTISSHSDLISTCKL
ncbi:MAG TPA: M14 family zinc carboxypeptidase [Pseudobdellovibrionaceae bacterium]|nr:M14 family zinc carboxypeptidase [Pseudobdellovibrionaceae bacterium]